jgi:transcriptional regulator with XRE-family HTH domain
LFKPRGHDLSPALRPRSPEQILFDVARRAAELREALGLTQEALAARLGMSDVYLRRIESGRVNLSVKSLARLAAALGVEITALFEAPRVRARRGPGRPKSRA